MHIVGYMVLKKRPYWILCSDAKRNFSENGVLSPFESLAILNQKVMFVEVDNLSQQEISRILDYQYKIRSDWDFGGLIYSFKKGADHTP
ncbi:MAG: hypothetical protein OEY59_06640 [Deltaproteobacteria bacterium]|nr:hypothetical protein [Deltaproteobacteria bacterium]